MKHYVCTGGCNGESQHMGMCESQFCPKEGKPLVSCDCEDGLHQNSEEDGKESDTVSLDAMADEELADDSDLGE